MFKILGSLLIATALFAHVELGKVISKKEFHEYTKDEIKQSFLVNDYAFITGDSELNFNNYLDQAVLDKDWQKAQNALFREYRAIPNPPSGFPVGLIKDRGTANWIDTIRYLGSYVQRSGNPVAAFQGLSIIANYVLVFYPDKNIQRDFFDEIVAKYMPMFADALYQKRFCYGAYMKLFFDWQYSDNRYEAIDKVKDGKGICSSQLQSGLIQPYIEEDFRLLFAKAEINTQIHKEKESKNVKKNK